MGSAFAVFYICRLYPEDTKFICRVFGNILLWLYVVESVEPMTLRIVQLLLQWHPSCELMLCHF